MSATVYIITGASRGLGFGYSQALLARDLNAHVIATARDPASAKDLIQLKEKYGDRLSIVKLDVSSAESAKEAAKAIDEISFAKDGADVLIANAGVAVGGFGQFTEQSVQQTRDNLETNVFGVMYAVEAFLPLLRRKSNGKKQIFITSSTIASIGGPYSQSGGGIAYAISKAAVNMFTVKLARQLASEGFTTIPHHPGYVKTAMGGEGAEITVEESINGTLDNVFLKVTPADNAKFYDYKGDILPW